MTNQTTAAVHVSSRPAGGQLLPLSLARAGEQLHIHSISGKDETRRFLSSLGFVEGAEVSVVTEMDGNVIVSIKGTRLAISKAMARRVMTA